LVDQITGEAIGPELIWPFTKRDLELDLLGLVVVAAEEVEGVFEDLGTKSNRGKDETGSR